MGLGMNSLFIVCLLASIYSSNGCTIQGVTVWALPIELTIQDYHEGVFLQRTYSGISSVTLTSTTDLNGGPYFSINMENGMLTLSTNEEYKNYEENETVQLVTLTFSFTCAAGNTPTLNVQISINDNNNNPPLWKTQDAIASADTLYEFTIAPPVAPGFLVTNCISDIIVRDIDLTTYRIDFSIENNPYFEIAYDEASSTVDKEFKAAIRTTTFIRSLPEPIILTIIATDVDETGDDPITRSTTVTIHGNSDFELPVEPVFTQPFYLAQYTENNQIILGQSVSLQQGYDGQVQFSLAGDYAEDHFTITPDGNEVVLSVTNVLPTETLQLGQDIYLVVNAAREYTSGASATVVVQLPEVENLEFERPHYEGIIVDNTLQLTELILSQGYQGSTVTVVVEDYPSFFTASVVGNIITLSMAPLDDNIIQENSFINLRVTASTDSSSASTIVTLEIVKDDVATPVFGESLYEGTYDSVSGLTVAPILLEQGYDETVTVSFSGEHESYFELIQDGASFTLRVTGEGLPAHILRESHLLLSIQATKPRTVGATAVVSITLPEVENLEFERPHYEGIIVDNTLQLTELILSQGYQGSTVTAAVEDYPLFFTALVNGNIITLSMAPLNDNIIQENSFINLRVTASTDSSSASTIVTLEIVKDDVATPVFGESLYEGTYDSVSGLTVAPILLEQGYDETVTVSFSGEHESYFEMIPDGASSTLRVTDEGLPSHILRESHLLLTVQATKPRTVGATAVVSITLPGARELQFEAHSYEGSLQDNILTLDTIILNVGYDEDVTFSLSGDYSSSFGVSNVQNQVTITLPTQLPQEVISENNFLMLTLTASSPNGLPATAAVLLEIIKDDVTTPVFSEAIYYGNHLGSLDIEIGNMNLVQGYDDSVTFRIAGENSEYFEIAQNQNSVTLTVRSSIPEEVIFNEKVFVFNIFADKPLTVGANAAISIKFHEDLIEPTVMQFGDNAYTGVVENNLLTLGSIVLETGFADGTQFLLSGDFASFFTHTNADNIVSLSMPNGLPAEVLENNQFIVLELEAHRERAVSAFTSIIIEIIEEEIVVPVFGQAYYTGMYTEENTLQFLETITLQQGYDETVTFRLEGESAAWFDVTPNGNSASIVITSPVPQDILDSHHQLLFTVVANKPNTINGHAAISIDLPNEVLEQEVLRFSQSSYEGQLDGSELQIPTITLSNEITENVVVSMSGTYGTYFTATLDTNIVRVDLTTDLPAEVISNNEFIVINIVASRPEAISGYTALVLSLVRESAISTPVFEYAYYTGEISEQGALVFDHTIRLIQGYDESVLFTLEGDESDKFTLTQTDENSLTLSIVEGGIEQIETIGHLVFSVVASKTGSVSGEAAIVIYNTEIRVQQEVLQFTQSSYEGQLDGSELQTPTITLSNVITENVLLSLSGAYSTYFTATLETNIVRVELTTDLPAEVISNNEFIVIDIIASRLEAISGYTALVLSIVKEPSISTPVFEQAYYTGEISEQGQLVFDHTIRLIQGYDESVSFTLNGDGSESFVLTLTGQNSLSLSIAEGGMEQIENYSHLVFSVVASKTGSISGEAAIVIHNTDAIEPTIVVPVFAQAYYTGIYTEENNLQFLGTITLLQGYDETVTFGLEGESAAWFDVAPNGNSASIVISSPVPQDILDSHNQLLFSVVAYKPNTINGYAAISIDLPEDILEQEVLRFTQSSYEGKLDGSELQVPTISLSNQITHNVLVSLSGDYATYFTVTFDMNIVHIELTAGLPAEVISNNEFIVIDIIASRPDAVSGYTALVLSIIKEPSISTPVFEQAYYTGEISEQGQLVFDHTIRLIQGYDESVSFTLQGDGSERFVLTETSTNSLSLSVAEGGLEQIENFSHLVFSVVASKTGSVSGEAAIVIHNTDSSIVRSLRFSQNYYRGSIEENELTVESISLVEGYGPDVDLALIGDYANFFQLVNQGGTYTLQLMSDFPAEVIETNNVLVFSLEAYVGATRAYSTVVIELIKNDNTEINALTFEETYYIGTYSATTGSMPDVNIIVASGYDGDTMFTIEEGIGSLFSVAHVNSIVTITLVAPLPTELFINHQPVIFSLNGINSVGSSASATIVVTLEDELSELTVLGFERNNYLGTIESDALTLQPVILNQGFSPEVHFTLQGDLSSYFDIIQQGSTVNIVLQTAIPEQAIPANNIIVLELQATAVQAISASATVVFDVIKEEFAELAFNAPYYVGQYSAMNGLQFENIISLDVGYDENVQFLLEGEHTQWFALQIQGNVVTLTLSSVIPPVVVANHHQLVFSVIAQKPNSNTASATVVISLVEDYTDPIVLGFEQSSYLGSITNDVLSIEPIILTEGYSENVIFSVHGDLASYFDLHQYESTVNIVLHNAIPEQALPSNGLILLEVRASASQAIPATTTLVIDAKRGVAGELVFSAAHYIGQYSETDGLEFVAVISLAEGFDDDVEFSLDGDHAQWFGLQVQGNSVTLTMTGAIPPAILVNNHQLVFGVTAQKPNTNTARAAIVISLVEDFTDAVVLGFEQSSYFGAINNNELSIEPIVLNEGYSNVVIFTLHGELSSYFNLQQQASTVNIVLQSAIPEQSLPSNGIVMLDVRASAPQAISATTTVVIEAERAVSRDELVFSGAHYIGQYSETNGLEFDAVISLAEGFDDDVEFSLDGDHAQWFGLQVQGNSVTLTMTGAIPPAILVNNHQLVFGVTAQKPNTNTARAAIVISLLEAFTDAVVLAFEQSSYFGAINNNELSIEPIVLNEGFSNAVIFTLHGELSSYFNLQQQASTVNIVLQSAIPEQSLASNGIVILDVRASAPQAISATTTVVIEAERAVSRDELVFSGAHYIGQYSEANGLQFDAVISLAEGFDDDVEFSLDGDHAQWFGLQVQGNSVTLITAGAIPPAILVNNHQLVFSVIAQKPSTNTARAAIVISLVEDFTDAVVLGFEQTSYFGAINNNELSIEPIVLNEGFSNAVIFTLHGELSSYFNLQQQASTVNIVLQSAIPEQSLPSNGIVMLDVRASAPQAISATTTVVIEAERAVSRDELVFSAAHYIGQYSVTNGLEFDAVILLAEGFDDDVEFSLDGDHAQWFGLQVQGNSVTLVTAGAIPPAILVNNHQLVFSVIAQKPNTNTARAAIVISLVEDFTDAVVLGFEQTSYFGAINNNELSIEPIVLNEGFSNAVIFTLHGELSSYFNLQQQASTVNIVLQSAIPEQSLPSNGIVMLDVRASAPQAISATTTVVIEAERVVSRDELVFSAAHYIGQYSETNGLEFDAVILLAEGFDDDVEFSLDGDHAQWFGLQVQGNSVTLVTAGAIPPAILVNNHQLVFSVIAQKPNTNTARAAIVISLVEDFTDAVVLGFEQSSYFGAINNNDLSIEPIVLNEGFSNAVIFTLHGELSSYFNLQQQASTVNIVLQSAIPEQSLPSNGIVMLDVRASAPQAISATTTVVIEVERAVSRDELVFSAAHYIGQYSEANGLEFDAVISLAEGFDDDVEFSLDGDHAQWFGLQVQGNSVTLVTAGAIPPAILVNNHQLVFRVIAQKPNSNTARSAIVISLVEDSGSVPNESFDKVLYEGTINLNVVQHEPITITGFTGSNIEILGVYRDLFSATVSDGTVQVGASGTLSLPEDTTHAALELRAGDASAVLILNVIQSETPELPTVTFGSPSYVLRADMVQTGLVGQVHATASNGEPIAYSLDVDNGHLQERISVNSNGEIHLSAPTNTGIYSFQVIATSIITQVEATATVQLTVEVAALCGDDHTLPPLIILDRDEEEPHSDLVVLDSVAQEGCQFRLTNRWPLDQDWLYVDDTGLHARIIDREDPRIAFMALSQVQVELVLECASDAQSRVKRSTSSPRLDWLGPYEYGNNKWILTDTILYNSRRSFVNFIVNDINDNSPIFVGKENEPIVCGYPVPELEEIILPRALAELKATDADVGENAALSFWSSADVLAVSAATGSVHVRDGASLTHDQLLTVSVTDLNGREDGLTGTIQLMVKLVDTSNIAVVTVRNAFLDQEETILNNLSSAVGYEVKVLSSAVISDDPADSQNARTKRDVTGQGASLQLYVYGVIDREPVAVDRLTSDITEHELTGVDVTSTVSLDDYLEGREIYGGSGRDIGLLIATIVLSVLLFILIVAIAIWFFLRWRKARNYEQFSDANSVASRTETLEEAPKLDTLTKPRLNIDELKRSERRLQEMLDAPVESESKVTKATTSQANPAEAFDTIINIAPTDTTLPIVIQSIDKLKDDLNSGDEDEYGERKKDRRKSVVTFNENVEKIIHVDDIPDDDSSEVEVFKF